MQSPASGFASLFGPVWDQLKAGADYVPDLLAALLILILGLVIARIVRRTTQRLALSSNRFLEHRFPSGILAEARVSSLAATLLGTAAFWVVLLVAVTISARAAGLSAVSDWLYRITAHLPHVIAAVTIVIVGYFFSVYVREQLAPQLKVGGAGTAVLLGRIMQTVVLAIALIVGLDQIGVDVVLLIALAVVCVAAVLTGLAVAFALGARSYVGNLIGAQTARRNISPGVRIRIDDIEGEVLEITATQIAINTDQGKKLVPAKYIDDHVTTIMVPRFDKDSHDV